MLPSFSGPLCTLTLGVVNAATALPNDSRATPPELLATVRFKAPPGLTIGSHPLPEFTAPTESPRPPRFEPLCTAPCTTNLPFGEHELAVLRGEEAPLVAFPKIRLTGPATLELEVTSHESQRTFGFWLTIVSATLGVASTTVGLIPKCNYDESCAQKTSLALWGGIGLISFGGLFGVPLMLREDEVTLKLAPATHRLQSAPNR